ncbi:diguanylate cyclase (plasmid) [Aquincola tertiaricarbonis]|uniref:Diguanylate cyclase n=1 Tax=Aquincola tertiaricarbonis TaxID=391953 RepID=A0ABY4SG87_AQUTE|nr:diguanylate cyclase [Aquincola tertiaricarbonis]URI11998.1 diguanylate cyclase [Aquincola tertiaricarbonis]
MARADAGRRGAAGAWQGAQESHGASADIGDGIDAGLPIHPSFDGGAGVAALFIDLDRFKHVNDTGGHAAGDRMLQQVAQLLLNGVRRDDLVARLGR